MDRDRENGGAGGDTASRRQRYQREAPTRSEEGRKGRASPVRKIGGGALRGRLGIRDTSQSAIRGGKGSTMVGRYIAAVTASLSPVRGRALAS